MRKILIVEDDPDIAAIERDYLELDGCQVEIAADGEAGLALGLGGGFDLILLDLMLPGMDGFTVCRRLREKIDTPILMVTARREDIDKIRGLGLGADDYIEKPFSPSVLAARVKAHLARYERLTGGRKQTSEIQISGISLHTDTRRVFVEGREVELKNKEYELLLFFLLHVDIVFSREELYEKIWGLEAMGDNATVAVHINRLREKIEPDPARPRYIQTVWGRDTGFGDNKFEERVYVAYFCVWVRDFRGRYIHSGQVRHSEDRFHRGYRYPDHRGPGLLLADGIRSGVTKSD